MLRAGASESHSFKEICSCLTLSQKTLKEVDGAFRTVKREHFLPPHLLRYSEDDVPLPIGYEQTISQPTTVRLMLCWLDVEPGHKVLDVGSGSGWTTAMLAYLVGEKGRVFATERIPELKTFGENNCKAQGFDNIEFHLTEDTLGLPEYAPYDRILVSAAAQQKVPLDLLAQLAANGKMVIPELFSVVEVKKNSVDEIDYRREHYGFSFVPLIEP